MLASELVIRARTHNAPGFPYGPYRVWGDLQLSRYFRVDGAPSIEPVVRNLSCRADAEVLGRSFQGGAAVRRITALDHQKLSAAAIYLPLEPRARVLPEERLESALLADGADLVESLIRGEQPGIAEERRIYLCHQAPARNRSLVRELQERYAGRCQLCLWDPRDTYGQWLCEGHHLHWLSRGGADELSNLLLVCPNHHRAIHQCDAPLDYQDLALDFGVCRERVRLDTHLVEGM